MRDKNFALDNSAIEAAFGGFRFGDQGKTETGRRQIVLLALMKLQAGYAIGSSMREVLWRLRLVTEYNKVPTKSAKRWMYSEVKALAGGEA